MSLFEDLFAESAAELFEQLGEKVVYWPGSGSPRTITAIVKRLPPAPIPEVANQVAARATVKVFSDPTTPLYGGISQTEIDTGPDQIELAMLKGRATQRLAFGRIAKNAAGLLVIELQ